MLQSIRIFPVTAVGRTATRLNISATPRFRPDRADEGCRMKSAGTDLHIQGLHYQATLFGPVILQGLNQALKAAQIGRGVIVHLDDWLKAGDYNQLEFFLLHFPYPVGCIKGKTRQKNVTRYFSRKTRRARRLHAPGAHPFGVAAHRKSAGCGFVPFSFRYIKV